RYAEALDNAERLLGFRLERFLRNTTDEPVNGADFKRIATMHAFGDVWPRTEFLDTRTRALVSVTIAATLGVLEPLRGQLRIALNSGPPRKRSPRCSSRSRSTPVSPARSMVTRSPPRCSRTTNNAEAQR